jgi:Tfp pilus assembly protein PilN
MKAVNLLPADRGASSAGSRLSVTPLLLAAVVDVVAVVAGAAVEIRSASSKLNSRQTTLTGLEQQIAKLPKPRSGLASGDATLRLTTLTSAATSRTTWDGFLYAISRVMPEDVWLINLSVTGGGAGVTASSPDGFTLTGYTYGHPAVARLMRRLELVPWLTDIGLTTSTKTQLGRTGVVQFTVSATVTPQPEVGS